MTARVRGEDSDPLIEKLEEEWWNQNASTVESVWALPKILRTAVRQHYLRKARAFFLNNTEERPAKLIEIGCGSGWVGRFAADRGHLDVIGTDLSTAQIELARRYAIEDGLHDICRYEVGNLASLRLSGSEKSHCVMIHAILHHLTWSEITTVLGEICALGRGTSVFVYEPVKLSIPKRNASISFRVARRIGKYAIICLAGISALSLRALGGKRDEVLARKLELLNRLASEKGWELSPKEIVFSEEELTQVLSKYFEIQEVMLCNYLSLIVGQQAGLYRGRIALILFANFLLPVARVVERVLFRIGILPFLADSHVFLGYLCRVR